FLLHGAGHIAHRCGIDAGRVPALHRLQAIAYATGQTDEVAHIIPQFPGVRRQHGIFRERAIVHTAPQTVLNGAPGPFGIAVPVQLIDATREGHGAQHDVAAHVAGDHRSSAHVHHHHAVAVPHGIGVHVTVEEGDQRPTAAGSEVHLVPGAAVVAAFKAVAEHHAVGVHTVDHGDRAILQHSDGAEVVVGGKAGLLRVHAELGGEGEGRTILAHRTHHVAILVFGLRRLDGGGGTAGRIGREHPRPAIDLPQHLVHAD